jgi:hypothetical protein
MWLIDMDNLNSSAKQKNIIFIILLFIVVVILGIIFRAIDSSGRYTVNIRVLPETAKLSINSIPISEKPLLYPGLYTIKAEAEGFATITQDVNVEQNFSTDILLVPLSDEATKWYNDNIKLYDEGFDPNLAYHPIQNQLPYISSIFSIESKDTSAGNDVLTLTITALPGYRNAPINKISSMGYSPEDYKYSFDHRNPFEDE